MKTALSIVFVTAFLTSASILAAQAPAIDLNGHWYGVGHDLVHQAPDGMTLSWTALQADMSIAGTVRTTGLNGVDGSCSGCHRAKTGSVAIGSVSGSTLTLTMDFPGHNGEITELCTASITGSALNVASDVFTMTYTGNDSCESVIESGTIEMRRDPSITTQPASRAIAPGQSVTLSATALGSAALTYQWYRGTSGSTTNPIAGAIGSTYTTPALTETTRYWMRVSNAKGTVDSTTATLGLGYAPFTDDTLTAGATIIRAVHITELRERINAVRVRFGLSAYPYANLSLVPGMMMTASHLLDLRAALAEAYAAAHAPPPSYAEAIVPGVAIKAAHLTEIRSALVAIE